MIDTYKYENFKEFMALAPTLREIDQGLKSMQDKEVLIYKVILDILGSYLRLFKGSNSKEYRSDYLKLCLKFYKKINKDELSLLVNI